MSERAGQDGYGPGLSCGGGRLFDLGGVFVALLVIVALKANALWMFIGATLAPFNHRDRYSTEPIEIEIGTVGYSVPGNYVSVLPQGRPGSYQFAKLTVLRQGFEPRTLENAAEGEPREVDNPPVSPWRPGLVVNIRISSREVVGTRLLQRFVDDGAYATETASFGLLRYAGGRLDRIDEVLYTSGEDYRTADGGPAVILCDPKVYGMRDYYGVTLDCVGGYRAPDGAWIRYQYFTNDLEDWRWIDEQVRSLVGGFARTQPVPG